MMKYIKILVALFSLVLFTMVAFTMVDMTKEVRPLLLLLFGTLFLLASDDVLRPVLSKLYNLIKNL